MMNISDRERLYVSIAISLVLYAAVFLLLNLFFRNGSEPFPEYMGPLSVKISIDSPERSANDKPAVEPLKVAEGDEEKIQQTQERPLETPVPRDKPALTAKQEDSHVPQPATETVAETKEQEQQVATVEDSQPLEVEKSAPITSEGTTPSSIPQETPLLDSSALTDLDKALAEGASQSSSTTKTQQPSQDSSIQQKISDSVFSDISWEWENPAEARKLLKPYVTPAIPDEVKKELPPKLEIVISFTVLPEGRVTALNIVTDTGYPLVESAVITAIRQWKFERVNSNKVVDATLHYVISSAR